jgi:hypothetical protein
MENTIPTGTMLFRQSDRVRYLPRYCRKELVLNSKNSLRNFGAYYAWKEGYHTAVFLDEECDTRIMPDYLEQIPVGKITEVSRVRTSSNWYNPIWQLYGLDTSLYARGYPYEWRGLDSPIVTVARPIYSKFNEGLWDGDTDVDILDRHRTIHESSGSALEALANKRVVVGRGQHLPLSCLNMQAINELLPALFFHFDDVSTMYILKAFMDARGDVATVGDPVVRYCRTPNSDEASERHLLMLIRPVFQDAVDHAMRYVHADTYREMARTLGGALLRQGDHLPGLWGQMIRSYANHMIWWSGLFNP